MNYLLYEFIPSFAFMMSIGSLAEAYKWSPYTTVPVCYIAFTSILPSIKKVLAVKPPEEKNE